MPPEFEGVWGRLRCGFNSRRAAIQNCKTYTKQRTLAAGGRFLSMRTQLTQKQHSKHSNVHKLLCLQIERARARLWRWRPVHCNQHRWQISLIAIRLNNRSLGCRLWSSWMALMCVYFGCEGVSKSTPPYACVLAQFTRYTERIKFNTESNHFRMCLWPSVPCAAIFDYDNRSNVRQILFTAGKWLCDTAAAASVTGVSDDYYRLCTRTMTVATSNQAHGWRWYELGAEQLP